MEENHLILARPRRRLARGLDLAIVLLILSLAAILLSGGGTVSLGGARIGLRSTGTAGFLLALAIPLRLVFSGRLGLKLVPSAPGRAARNWAVWAVFSLAYLLYCLKLGLTPFWKGYFILFLFGWATFILLRLSGREPVLLFSRRGRLALVATAAALFFLVAYGEEPHAPRHRLDMGIWTRYDQSWYLKMSRDFSRFRLEAENYRYGPGYPLLGALFADLVPVNPFLVPNLLLYTASAVFFYLAGERLLGPASAALAVVLSLGPPFVEFFCLPWNSAVSVTAAGLLLLLALSPVRSRLAAAGFGLALGWSFAARYVDALLLLPLGLAALWGKGGRNFVRAALLAGGIMALVLASHWALLGSPFHTPYYSRSESGLGDQTPAAYRIGDIPSHLFQVFFDPFSFPGVARNRENYSILGRAFILAAFPLGLVALGRLRRSRAKTAWAGFLISLALGWGFYGSYFAGGADNIVYGNLRYYLPWIPGAAIISLYGLFRASGRKVGL